MSWHKFSAIWRSGQWSSSSCSLQQLRARALMCTSMSTSAGARGASIGGSGGVDVGVRQQQRQTIENLSEEEWVNAKDYKTIPGPSSFQLMREFMPGGEMHGANFLEMYRILRRRYGDFFILRGSFGRGDLVCTYNPDDFETVYRTEGVWPVRTGLGTIEYYRRVKNPQAYGGIVGLVSAQGKNWAHMRQKVNPIMMKVQTMRQNLPEIDVIAKELVDKIESVRHPVTGLLNTDIINELRMWSFESICYVALNSRLQLITGKADADALRMNHVMVEFLQSTFDYDIAPSIWRYVKTPGFRRLMRYHDELTAIATKFVDAALKRIETEGSESDTCVLEKLMRIDKTIAVVMAIDMLFGGLDTTSTTVLTTLYLLATNPAKQCKLRAELRQLMPTAGTALTVENTKIMPYLRACIKESMRITTVAPGTMRHTGRDVVLSGYRVPHGTGVHMSNMELCNSDEHFPRSGEYLPERWLKAPKGQCSVEASKSHNPFVYLPFGFGPRTCIGKRLAHMNMEVLLARLLRRYKVSWTDAKNGIKYGSNLILVPQGEMKFKFELVEE